jgi:cobalt transporter subunit CbtB
MAHLRSRSVRFPLFFDPSSAENGRSPVMAVSNGHAAELPGVRPDERTAVVATIAPALATIALGLVVLFVVGFLQTPAVHNGVHDTRHATGFPCH